MKIETKFEVGDILFPIKRNCDDRHCSSRCLWYVTDAFVVREITMQRGVYYHPTWTTDLSFWEEECFLTKKEADIIVAKWNTIIQQPT